MTTATLSSNEQAILQTISNHTKIPIERINKDSTITELVADSFLLIELMLNLQDTLNIHLDQEDLEEVNSVNDLIELLEERMDRKAS